MALDAGRVEDDSVKIFMGIRAQVDKNSESNECLMKKIVR